VTETGPELCASYAQPYPPKSESNEGVTAEPMEVRLGLVPKASRPPAMACRSQV
jgi:hypothetical protein